MQSGVYAVNTSATKLRRKYPVQIGVLAARGRRQGEQAAQSRVKQTWRRGQTLGPARFLNTLIRDIYLFVLALGSIF